MVDAKKKFTPARARIAHKLAKYVRALPVHVNSSLDGSAPSVTHLSTIVD